MKNNVKPKSTRQCNLNRSVVSSSVLRNRAYAWHLSTAAQLAVCRRIFSVVAAGATGPVTAPVHVWLSTPSWIGLRMLLGHIARRASDFCLDEAAVFNKLSEAWLNSCMNIRDGRHLHNTLQSVAKSRAIDSVRQVGRVLLADDLSDSDDESSKELHSFAAAYEAFESARRQAILHRIVAGARRSSSTVIADLVFDRFLEMEGEITQKELAKEFKITQCRVSRILRTRLAGLQVIVEDELGRPLNLTKRKPRVAKRGPGTTSDHAAPALTPEIS